MNALQFVKTPNVRIKRSRKKKNGDRSEDVPHVAITKADHSKVRKWVSPQYSVTDESPIIVLGRRQNCRISKPSKRQRKRKNNGENGHSQQHHTIGTSILRYGLHRRNIKPLTIIGGGKAAGPAERKDDSGKSPVWQKCSKPVSGKENRMVPASHCEDTHGNVMKTSAISGLSSPLLVVGGASCITAQPRDISMASPSREQVHVRTLPTEHIPVETSLSKQMITQSSCKSPEKSDVKHSFHQPSVSSSKKSLKLNIADRVTCGEQRPSQICENDLNYDRSVVFSKTAIAGAFHPVSTNSQVPAPELSTSVSFLPALTSSPVVDTVGSCQGVGVENRDCERDCQRYTQSIGDLDPQLVDGLFQSSTDEESVQQQSETSSLMQHDKDRPPEHVVGTLVHSAEHMSTSVSAHTLNGGSPGLCGYFGSSLKVQLDFELSLSLQAMNISETENSVKVLAPETPIVDGEYASVGRRMRSCPTYC